MLIDNQVLLRCSSTFSELPTFIDPTNRQLPPWRFILLALSNSAYQCPSSLRTSNRLFDGSSDWQNPRRFPSFTAVHVTPDPSKRRTGSWWFAMTWHDHVQMKFQVILRCLTSFSAAPMPIEPRLMVRPTSTRSHGVGTMLNRRSVPFKTFSIVFGATDAH